MQMKYLILLITLLGSGCESMRANNKDYQARILEIEKAYVRGDITKVERQKQKDEAFKAIYGRGLD